MTWGPVFQVEGSRLAAGEQREHLNTLEHSHSSEATASSGFPKAEIHILLSNYKYCYYCYMQIYFDMKSHASTNICPQVWLWMSKMNTRLLIIESN